MQKIRITEEEYKTLDINPIDWLAEQSTRWSVMEIAGWGFQEPEPRFGKIGIIMFRDGVPATFYMPKKEGIEPNHTQLLEYCEAFHSADK